jgi:hypothetical protein
LKIVIMLADTGLVHPDGTFSMLRGGIDRLWSATQPIQLNAAALIRFRADPSEKGTHKWRLVVVDIDGRRVAPDLEGTFAVPEEGGSGNVMIRFNLSFPTPGHYSFRVSADDNLLDEWPVQVLEKPPKTGKQE